MSNTDWRIKGHIFAACNCAWGCPCQFMSLPTDGSCHAVAAVHVAAGHFGDVKLSNLNAATVLSWPGAIHEGNGSAQMFIDERATAEQRDALVKILSGEDTDEGATVFQVFGTTLTTVHETQFVPVRFDCDMEKRMANVEVSGAIKVIGTPIKNPLSGEEHRARISLDGGFEYTTAELGSASIDTTGAIPLKTRDRHAHFAEIHMTQHGLAH